MYFLLGVFLKRWVFIPVLVVVVAVVFYGLLQATRKPFRVVVFSGFGHVLGDGFGAYEEGVQGVYIHVSSDDFSIVLFNSSRSVYVRFQEAYWRDEQLNIVASRLPSKNYRVLLSVSDIGVLN